MKCNILLTFNNTYINNVLALINSIACNIKENCNIYLLHSDVSMSNINMLQKYTKNVFKYGYSGELIDIIFQQNLVRDLPVSVGNYTWSNEMYYRLFAPYFLSNINRCLYLDSDVIVCGNIEEFYNQNFNNNYIIAVANDTQEKHKERLKLPNDKVYINTGVLLMDLEKIRNHYSISEIRKALYDLKKIYVYPDQDFINIFFQKGIGIAQNQYNYMASIAEINNSYQKEKDVRICHYVMEKPWTVKFPYNSDTYYLKYLLNVNKRIKLQILHRCYRFYQLILKPYNKRKIRWCFEKMN